MSKYMTEEEYVHFKESLRGIIIKIIIGAVIGVLVGKAWAASDGGEAFWRILTSVICFAGVPYAWSKIPVHALGWLALLIKLVVAILLGWIITPIALIYDLIQVKAYEKRHFSENPADVSISTDVMPEENQEVYSSAER